MYGPIDEEARTRHGERKETRRPGADPSLCGQDLGLTLEFHPLAQRMRDLLVGLGQVAAHLPLDDCDHDNPLERLGLHPVGQHGQGLFRRDPQALLGE